MSEIYQNLKKLVLEKKELKLNDLDLNHDNLVLNCDVDNIIHNIDILKRSPEFKFRQLIDILGVDYPQQSKRFEVIYLFLSHENNFRISLKIKIGDEEIVPTLTDTFHLPTGKSEKFLICMEFDLLIIPTSEEF